MGSELSNLASAEFSCRSPSPANWKGNQSENPQAAAANDHHNWYTEQENFERGDHVFRYFNQGSVRLQHHGIVIDVELVPRENEEAGEVQLLTIFDYSKATNKETRSDGGINVYQSHSHLWLKVRYGERSNDRIGASPPDLVIRRVDFLRRNSYIDADGDRISSLIPQYNVLSANCECVASWCKTGRFLSSQGGPIGVLSGSALLTTARLNEAFLLYLE